MTPYIAIVVTSALLALLGQTASAKFGEVRARPIGTGLENRFSRWTIFDIMAILLLIAFSGSRYYVGTDFPVYAQLFDAVDITDWRGALDDSPQEAGFTLLMLATKSVWPHSQAIFWVAATLTVIPVYIAIKRRSLNPCLALLVYATLMYAPSFNAVRQYMAVSLLLLAWTYLGKRNSIFVILSIAAVSFHFTALLAILFIAFSRNLFPTPKVAATLLTAAAIMATAVGQVPFLAQLLETVNPRYAIYLESGSTGLGAYLQIAAYLCLLILALSFRGRHPEGVGKEGQLAVLLLAGIALMIVGTHAIVLFRLSAYFTIFAVILLPNRLLHARDGRLTVMALIAFLLLYFALHVGNYGDVIPYRTYYGS